MYRLGTITRSTARLGAVVAGVLAGGVVGERQGRFNPHVGHQIHKPRLETVVGACQIQQRGTEGLETGDRAREEGKCVEGGCR